MTGRWKGRRVAVLMGGVSRERDISLRTGSAISAALRRQGCEVVDIDVSWGAELIAALKDAGPEIALVALHGKFGEDGCVQGLLEMMRIPYTGGGVMASSVGMDKVLCKRIAREMEIPCLPDAVFDSEHDEPAPFAASFAMEMPVIVKPSREGSTINMTIVRERRELAPAIGKAMESDSKVLIEKYVRGRELTVGLINGEALPALEIAPKSGFYDFASKYTKGMTDYIVPARISEALSARIQGYSRAIYREIDCEGTARVDFIAPSDEEAHFLEINTIPGMTELSLVPKAAAHVGIGFDEICLRLLDSARLKVNV